MKRDGKYGKGAKRMTGTSIRAKAVRRNLIDYQNGNRNKEIGKKFL